MEDISARIRSARLSAPPGTFPAVAVVPGCPYTVADAITRAIGPALTAQGWEVHLRAETGLAVLWVRPATVQVPLVGATQPALDVRTDVRDTPV